jgi:carboxylate-amine ligase
VETVATEDASPPVRSDLLRAAGWRASRYGVSGDLVHPLTWDIVPAPDALHGLVEHVLPALEAAGDVARVEDGLARLSATGNGARRQRATRERSDDLRGVVDDLVARTAATTAG